jgi:hypothetical protein
LDGTTHASLDEAIAKLPGRPVALLQSDRTASAAEAVLVCFSGQSGVRSFGTTSHGFASANESIDLPDGSRLILPTGTSKTATGPSTAQASLPDVRTRIGGSALLDARAWLPSNAPDRRRRRGCGRAEGSADGQGDAYSTAVSSLDEYGSAVSLRCIAVGLGMIAIPAAAVWALIATLGLPVLHGYRRSPAALCPGVAGLGWWYRSSRSSCFRRSAAFPEQQEQET